MKEDLKNELDRLQKSIEHKTGEITKEEEVIRLNQERIEQLKELGAGAQLYANETRASEGAEARIARWKELMKADLEDSIKIYNESLEVLDNRYKEIEKYLSKTPTARMIDAQLKEEENVRIANEIAEKESALQKKLSLILKYEEFGDQDRADELKAQAKQIQDQISHLNNKKDENNKIIELNRTEQEEAINILNEKKRINDEKNKIKDFASTYGIEVTDSTKTIESTPSKSEDTAKEAETKEAEAKEAETKEAETKEAETKEAETKEAETKEAETKEAETKEAETKEAETKEAEAKEVEEKEAEVKTETPIVTTARPPKKPIIEKTIEDADEELDDTLADVLGDEVPTGEIETTKGKITKIEIDITNRGSELYIRRENDVESQLATEPQVTSGMKLEDDDKKRLQEFEEKYSDRLEKIQDKGDKFVIEVMKNALAKGELEYDEAMEQLEQYVEMVEQDRTRDASKVKLTYDLYLNPQKRDNRPEIIALKQEKDTRKRLPKADRKYIEKQAKEAQKLGIADVKVPIWTKAKWAFQDTRFGKFLDGVIQKRLQRGNTGNENTTDYEWLGDQIKETQSKVNEFVHEENTQDTIFVPEFSDKDNEAESMIDERAAAFLKRDKYDIFGNRTTRTPEEIAADQKLSEKEEEELFSFLEDFENDK